MSAVLLSINADVVDRLSVLINYGADLNRQRTVLNPVFLPFLVLVFKKHIAIINPKSPRCFVDQRLNIQLKITVEQNLSAGFPF